MRLIKTVLLLLLLAFAIGLFLISRPLTPVGPALVANTPVDLAAAELQSAVVVGSNWDGTAEVFDPESFEVLARYNLVPDIDERFAEINDSLYWPRVRTHNSRLARWTQGRTSFCHCRRQHLRRTQNRGHARKAGGVRHGLGGFCGAPHGDHA